MGTSKSFVAFVSKKLAQIACDHLQLWMPCLLEECGGICTLESSLFCLWSLNAFQGNKNATAGIVIGISFTGSENL